MATSSAPERTRVHPDDIAPMSVLRAHVARYEQPDERKAWFAFGTSLPPFVVLWWCMYRMESVSYVATLLLSIPAAGFLVRTFIVQHDCGHGTFFASRTKRTWVGRACSLITLLPYGYFRHFHGAHHATSGNLDSRHVDIETITLREYRALSAWGRRKYRMLRHPLTIFGLAPLLYFVVAMRIPAIARPEWKRERNSILATNVALLIVVCLLMRIIGVTSFVRVQLPITLIASTTGMWLFYVQHQFEDTYWAAKGEWDYARAALEGSSYYALPRALAWFTGYIGYHHVHHLSPRVPSYRLVQCHEDTALFARVPRITLRDGFRCARLALWDEDRRRLVSFREIALGE